MEYFNRRPYIIAEIKIVSYHVRWPRQFGAAVSPINKALIESCLDVYHIDSTYISGL